jgi:hypothetical protein
MAISFFEGEDKVAFIGTRTEVDWYKRQYYLILKENAMLEEEFKALREHINELQTNQK